jgi:tRNA (guanine-N7-)-methyltransferase
MHLKTDSLPLYEYSVECANASGATIHVSTSDLYATLEADPVLDIKTTYEKRFLAEGLKICYLSISWPAQ